MFKKVELNENESPIYDFSSYNVAFGLIDPLVGFHWTPRGQLKLKY